MKLYTGYFAKHGKHPDAVCIAGHVRWFPNLPKIPELAPTRDLLMDYKRGGLSWEDYTKRYMEQLRRLNIDEIPLEDGMILLCYERPEKHCHRHLVAEWLRSHGHDVSELE